MRVYDKIKQSERCKKYRSENKEKVAADKKEWREANRAKYNQYFVLRRKKMLVLNWPTI